MTIELSFLWKRVQRDFVLWNVHPQKHHQTGESMESMDVPNIFLRIPRFVFYIAC